MITGIFCDSSPRHSIKTKVSFNHFDDLIDFLNDHELVFSKKFGNKPVVRFKDPFNNSTRFIAMDVKGLKDIEIEMLKP